MSTNEKQFRDMLDRYVKGNTTAEEQKLLDDFFKSYESDVSKEELFLIDERSKNEILEQIHNRIHPRRRFIPLAWRAAAAVAIIAASIFVIRNQFDGEDINSELASISREQTPRGQKAVIELPDGSIVHLNSETELIYAVDFSSGREVKLTRGEAYFEVKHDRGKPFVVRDGLSAIQVLGTSFNVRSDSSMRTEITLVSGKVKVSSASGDTDLKPGQQAVVDHSSSITTQTVNIKKFVSWKDNILFFDQTKLEDAVDVLEKWYDAEIIIQNPEMKQCKITGQYRDESLENVIKSLQFLLNASAEFKTEKQITISGSRCK